MRIGTGFFLVFSFIALFFLAFVGVSKELDEFESMEEIMQNSISSDDFILSENSYIYDSNGQLISEIYNHENRLYLPYDEIPKQFVQAVIATEDQHYFTHKGFDLTGITRAFLINSEKERIEQGGSTITQQLVKMIYMNYERSYQRKLTEVLYAYQLEQIFSKEKILELYVNSLYFQNGVYGIETASQYYFSKKAQQLSLAEMAFLSAIPNNPNYYNPLSQPENTHKRKNWILSKMHENGFINEKQVAEAQTAEITLIPNKKTELYPDYVTYVHYELEQLIAQKHGFADQLAAASTQEEKNALNEQLQEHVQQLLAQGIKIYTALQPELQQKIHEVVERHLPEKTIQAATVIIDHKLKKIVAISGGKNYRKFDFHRGFQAFRQPGSAIKPLLVFAPYLATTNAPITKTISAAPFCKADYCPENYGGAVLGTSSVEAAFKHSINTAAVRMLDQISVETGFSYLAKLPFEKIVAADYRLPAALGGITHGVSPLEITAAYTVFANNGQFQMPRAIEKIVDKNDTIIYQWQEQPQQLWSASVNTLMNTLLRKVVTEGTGRRAAISNGYAAGKTGTSSNFLDLWFVGLTDNYTTGIWVGEDLPKNLEVINARNPHLLIWRDLMKK